MDDAMWMMCRIQLVPLLLSWMVVAVVHHHVVLLIALRTWTFALASMSRYVLPHWSARRVAPNACAFVEVAEFGFVMDARMESGGIFGMIEEDVAGMDVVEAWMLR